MKRTKAFLFNAAYLAAINIFLRFAAVSFNAYVSAKIGARSMGLFTLVMSVYGFAVTLSLSGVNLASMRLTAEKSALVAAAGGDGRSFRAVTGGVAFRCTVYALLFSVPTGTALFFLSPYIAERLISDARVILSLRVLAAALPAISVTSALSGYFTGLRKVYKNALSSVTEQAVKICVTSAALTVSVPFLTDRVEYSCLAVVGGSAVSEALSLILNVLMFLTDNRRPSHAKTADAKVTGKTSLKSVAAVAMPIAVGALARQGLSTAEHLSIPWGMKKSGLNGETALASYGILQGMVFPLVLFPSAVIASAGGLLIPELAECRAVGDRAGTKRMIGRSYRVATRYAILCGAVFFFFSSELGRLVYSSAEAGSRIAAVAPLVPIMYFDTTTDCMLKGIGEQVHSMKINVIDASSSLLLVLILVPSFGVAGYVVSVYFCETLNCVLSFLRLRRVTGIGLDPVRNAVIPAACAAAAGLVTSGFFAGGEPTPTVTAVRIVLCILVFLSLDSIINRIFDKKSGYGC